MTCERKRWIRSAFCGFESCPLRPTRQQPGHRRHTALSRCSPPSSGRTRWRFVRFATDQKASTTLAFIAEALAAIGGVPARVLADRMACLKGGVVANVVVPIPDYVRLAGHYLLTELPCVSG